MYPPEPIAATAAITIRLGGIDADDVHVLELRGREGLNELFDYTVRLCTSETNIDLAAILKSACTIEIAAGVDGTRYIHGIVAGFERLDQRGYYTDYSARIVPLHWILTKRFCSRIFQVHNCPDMTVAGIIRKVLLNGGVPADMFRFVLSGEQKSREYVVQYRETEWDFVSRLMEEEGLTCYFEHSDAGHLLVIGEAPTLFRVNPIYPTLTYCDPNGMDLATECVFRIHERRSVEYGAIGLTDYNFKLPGLDLRTRYPGGALPLMRYSARTAPPPKQYYGPPAAPPGYGEDSPEYGGSPADSYGAAQSPAGYGGQPGESGYGDPASPPESTGYNGSPYGTGGSSNGSYGRGQAPSGYGGQPGELGYGGRSTPPAAPGYNGSPSSGGGGSPYNGNGSGSGAGYGAPSSQSNEGAYNGGSSQPAAPSGGYPSQYGDSPDQTYDSKFDRTPYEPKQPDAPGYGRYEPDHRGGAPYPYENPTPPSYNRYKLPPPPLAKPYTPTPPPPMDYGCSAVKVDYPGDYMERAEGVRQSQLRLEEHQSAAVIFEISANVRGLMAGHLVVLEYHTRQAFNAEYLITELVIHAAQSQGADEYGGTPGSFRFDVQARAIPAHVAYRPPCKTARPFVHGAQTALVVGPSTDEIYTDAYGRVKVQFHWDPDGLYDEYSSCWIRVSQGMAGGQYGMMFLPRVGQEIIVDFLEGNPDCPIITGRVYNGDCMPPYKLPDYKTRSCIRTQSSQGGYGANEIRFEDRKDYEHLLVYAQRDYHLRSRADCYQAVGADKHTLVYGNHYEKIAKKSNIEVCLDRKEKIGGNQSLTVRGDVAERIYGKHSESCADYSLKAESGEVVIEATTAITFKVGGNFIKIDAAGIHVMGTIINLNCGGAAGIAYPKQPQLPYAPKKAFGTEYGYDMRYSATPTPPPPDGEYEQPGHEPTEPPEDKPTYWVEVELVDEAGQAWPGEEYEVVAPNGDVHRGTLDANGQAHVAVETEGACQIRFPNLDMAAWERR